jgi:flagellar biosynthesis/type III secretory pathway M-ring protein FliF/YscJ
VSVIVELDPQWEVRSEKVLPTDPIVRSEHISKDSTDSAAKGGDPDASRNTSRTEKQDREYVTEIGERRTGRLAPEIKRLAVAVLYDKALEDSAGFDKEKLVSAVKAIVGWDSQRDSAESFSTMAGEFVPPEAEEAAAATNGFAEIALRWGPTVGQAFGVLVVVLFLRGLFRRAGRGRAPAIDTVEGMASVGASEEQVSAEERQKRTRREIERTIANDPAALAKMLESWLTEQKA